MEAARANTPCTLCACLCVHPLVCVRVCVCCQDATTATDDANALPASTLYPWGVVVTENNTGNCSTIYDKSEALCENGLIDNDDLTIWEVCVCVSRQADVGVCERSCDCTYDFCQSSGCSCVSLARACVCMLSQSTCVCNTDVACECFLDDTWTCGFLTETFIPLSSIFMYV